MSPEFQSTVGLKRRILEKHMISSPLYQHNPFGSLSHLTRRHQMMGQTVCLHRPINCCRFSIFALPLQVPWSGELILFYLQYFRNHYLLFLLQAFYFFIIIGIGYDQRCGHIIAGCLNSIHIKGDQCLAFLTTSPSFT